MVYPSILDCRLYGLSFFGCSLSYWQNTNKTMCIAGNPLPCKEWSIPLHHHQSSCHVITLNIQYRYITHPYKPSVLLPMKQGDVFIIPDTILERCIHSVVPTLTKAHIQQLPWARVEPWFILMDWECENMRCEGKGVLYSISCKHIKQAVWG